MNRYVRAMVLCVVALWGDLCNAQMVDTLRMSVDRLMDMVENNSKSIKTNKMLYESSLQAVKSAEAQRLPSIKANLSVGYLGNGWISDRNFSNGTSVYIPHFSNNFSVEASYMVYSGRAIENSIVLTKLQSQMSALQMQLNTQQTKFLILGYFLDLIQLQNQRKVLEQNLSLTENLINNMKTKFKQGVVLKTDITRYELQYETLKLQLLKVNEAIDNNNFSICTYLGLNGNVNIEPDESLLNGSQMPTNEEYWQHLATTESRDIKLQELKVATSNKLMQLEKSELLPKVSLFANNQFNGPITIEIPAINKNFNSWCVGASISYNLSALYKNKKKIKELNINSMAERENLDLKAQEVEIQIHNAYSNYKTSFKDIETQNKSVELANQNYTIVQNRFLNDLAIITDMIDASNAKLSSELNRVNSNVELLFNFYRLKFITNTL